MPTKKTTKSKKGKPQPQPQPKPQTQTQLAALSAFRVNLGPPFAGQGPYPDGAWGIFPAPDGRSVPCPGFWGYSRHYPTTGGMVVQLGAEPATGAVPCAFYSGYQYTFSPTVAGGHLIILTLNLGQVTPRPRYGRVQLAAMLQIRGPGGHWADFYENLPSNTGITMAISPTIQAGERYTLRFGVVPIVENAGYQSYGEIIVNNAELKQYLPYNAQAARLAPSKAFQGESVLSSLLSAGDEREVQTISLHEAATFGVGHNS